MKMQTKKSRKGEKMRLIDADALEKKLHEFALDEWNQRAATSWSNAFLECEDIVYNAPTIGAVPLEDYKSMEQTVNKLTKAIADAEPVKHGHWELSPFDGNWTCNKCGSKPYHSNMKNMNYCPNCGAKMDKRRKDGNT